MTDKVFQRALLYIAIAFTAFFTWTIIPPLLADLDVVGAFAAGFVNPYAAGYSTDVILCWCVLALWVWHERPLNIRGRWWCLALGIVPGVVVGFALYLVLRSHQLKPGTG